MSADNWAICPRCVEQAWYRFNTAHHDLGQAYGSISIEEFDTRREAIGPRPDPETYTTLREDYEIYGADDGEVIVSYSGRCTNCGLGTEFEHRRRFWTPELQTAAISEEDKP